MQPFIVHLIADHEDMLTARALEPAETDLLGVHRCAQERTVAVTRLEVPRRNTLEQGRTFHDDIAGSRHGKAETALAFRECKIVLNLDLGLDQPAIAGRQHQFDAEIRRGVNFHSHIRRAWLGLLHRGRGRVLLDNSGGHVDRFRYVSLGDGLDLESVFAAGFGVQLSDAVRLREGRRAARRHLIRLEPLTEIDLRRADRLLRLGVAHQHGEGLIALERLTSHSQAKEEEQAKQTLSEPTVAHVPPSPHYLFAFPFPIANGKQWDAKWRSTCQHRFAAHFPGLRDWPAAGEDAAPKIDRFNSSGFRRSLAVRSATKLARLRNSRARQVSRVEVLPG